MFTLAHLSDIHLGPLPRPSLRHLASKRFLGYLNWHRGRKELHRPETLADLCADMTARHTDHIAVTGDLVNISLPGEFAAALDWLTTLGDAEDVSVIPGNHDAYVEMDYATSIGLWQDFMRPDMAHGVHHAHTATGFPFIRIREPIAMVGLSTAIPTWPFTAKGRLNTTQLEALPGILKTLRERELFRVVLIHHPPLHGLTSRRRGLVDVDDLVPILQAHGAELVLYGHNHDQKLDFLDTRTGRTPVVCVPSASVARAKAKAPARYNLFEIDGNAQAGWSCEMIGRGLPKGAEPGSDMRELERVKLIG